MRLPSIALCVLLLSWFGEARAQSPTTGAIQGVITDARSGDAIPGVTIIVTASGVSTQSTISDERGSYKINSLPPGTYLVTFYYLDSTIERSDIIVGIQKTTPVYMKIGPSEG